MIVLLILLSCEVDVENNVRGAQKTSVDDVYLLLQKLRTIVKQDSKKSLSHWPSHVGGHQIVPDLKKMMRSTALRFRVVQQTMSLPSWKHFPFGHAAAQEIEANGLSGHDAARARALDITYCDSSSVMSDEPWETSLLTVLAIHWESVAAGVRLYAYLKSARARDSDAFQAGLDANPKVKKWFNKLEEIKFSTAEWKHEEHLFTTKDPVLTAGSKATAGATAAVQADNKEHEEPKPRAPFVCFAVQQTQGVVHNNDRILARCVGGGWC